jgi:hypothetical protein
MTNKPLTSTEKSVLFRKRIADAGLSEFRGIYATKEEKATLKLLCVAKLLELRNDN